MNTHCQLGVAACCVTCRVCVFLSAYFLYFKMNGSPRGGVINQHRRSTSTTVCLEKVPTALGQAVEFTTRGKRPESSCQVQQDQGVNTM